MATKEITTMSLIGQLPLAAIEIPCKDIEGSRRFYKDVMGFREIEDELRLPVHKKRMIPKLFILISATFDLLYPKSFLRKLVTREEVSRL